MFNESKPFAMALRNEAPKLLGWNLEAEDLELLHPHWQAFESPPFYYHLLLAIVYFFLMVASAIGNGIVNIIFKHSEI